MRNIYRSFLVLIAGATQKELLQHNRFFDDPEPGDAEEAAAAARVLRSGAAATCALREPARWGVDHLVSIVHPDTMRRWIREGAKENKSIAARRGRKRTAEQIPQADSQTGQGIGLGLHPDPWGAQKAGDHVGLAEHGQKHPESTWLRSGPQRGVGTWDEFLKLHAATL